MKVVWTENAEWHRDRIGDYIFEHFGYQRMETFIEQVDKTVNMIIRYPNIGSIDPLFSDRPYVYRSVIINGLSKLVYRINDDIIHIVAFWDTRQEPEAQTEQVKE